MAGNSKRTMLLDLKVNLDSKDAERNIASLGKDIMTLMNAMNSSGKGMNVFKELVSYISKLDSEMNAFRSKHANDFDRIFSGIDTTLLNQMQTIFGVTKAQLNEINALRDKVAAARKNPNTSADEIKSMEKEVRDLYAAVGKSGESGISGRGALETRLDRLEGSLNNFAKTWESVNDRVSKGFGSKGGSGTGTGAGAGSDAIADELDEMSREIQEGIAKLDKDIEELKRKKEELNQVISSDRKYSGDIDLNIDSVRKLVDEYNRLSDVMKTSDKNSGEYHDSLVKLVGVSAKLNAAFHKIKSSDEDVKAQFRDTILSEKDGLRSTLYSEVATKGGDRKHQDLVMKARDTSERYGGLIGGSQSELDSLKAAEKRIKKNKELGLSYSKVAKYASDYMEINSKYDADGNLSKVDEDNKKQIENQLKQLAKAKGLAQKSIKEVFEAVDMGNIASADDMYQKLCNVLGVDIPKNAQKAEDALKSVDRAASSTDSMTNDGLDKINEQPSKPDSKDVADINKVEGALEDVGSQAKEAFNAIGKGADKAKPSVDRLSQSLQKAFTDATNLQLDVLDGKTQGKETMNLVDSNGIVSSVQGDNYIVDGKVLVGQMISNLKDNIVMSLHDHPNAIDAFTPADVEMFAKQYYGQGIKLNGIIANGIIKTIDFNGMSQDVAMNISQSYFDNLSQAAKEYSELFSFDNGNLVPTPAVEKLAQTDPDKYQEINDSLVDLANASLEDAFKQNGVEPTIKEFTKSQIPQLSEYINTIQNSAQSALTPVEKLQNLITSLNPNKTIDWNKYNDDLIKFANNEVDAISTFNKISNDLKSDANAKDASKSYQKNLDAVQKDVAPQIEAEANAHRENANAIKEEVAAKDKLDSTIQGDDADDIARENGKLEEKLELLREIADAYGSNITNAKRNRYEDLTQKDMNDGLTSREEDRFSELGDEIEEAESNLKEFGATYDKITLKFAKGKDKDILPDDKGLRDLYKYADSMAYDEFNGKEIEDVIFTRKQEQAIIEQTNQGLQEQARIQERVAKEQKAASGTQMDDSRAEVKKTISSYEELCSVVERYNQLVLKSVTEGAKLTKQEDKELSDIQSRIVQTKTGGDPDKIVDHAINWRYLTDPIVGRVTNTDALAKYLGIEIPQAAEKASQAIKEVDNTNVDPKVDLSTKNELQEIEKQAEKTDSALEELDRQKVSTDTKKDNKTDVKTTSSDGASLKEYQQLEMLDAKLKEVKAAIEAKTQAFREEGSTVDSVVASEAAALEKLSSKLDEIVTKIKLVGDSFNQINSGSVDQVEGAIEAKQEKTPTTTSGVDTTSGKWALDSTLSATNSILQSILAAVSGSESASQMAEALNGAVADLKAAADALRTSANEVKQKDKNDTKDTSADSRKTKDTINVTNSVNKKSAIDIAREYQASRGSLSEKQIEHSANKMINNALAHAFNQDIDGITRNEEGKLFFSKAFSGGNTPENVAAMRKEYEAYDQILQQIGYHLGEWKETENVPGFSAEVIKNSQGFVNNLEQARNILLGINRQTDSAQKNTSFDDIKNDEVSNFEKYKKDVESSIHVTDKFKSKLEELHANLSNVKDADGLKSWKESFSGFQNEFDRFKAANQKVLTGQINAIKVEIGALNATKMQLLENINAYRQQYGLLNGGKSGKNYGNSAAIRETTRYNKFQQYANDADMGFKDSATFNAQLQKYISAYKQLMDLRSKFASKPVLTDRDVQEFNDAKQACADYGKELDKMIAKSNKLDANKYQSSAIGSDVNIEDASSRKQALTDFVTGMHDARESTIQFSKDYQECTFKMKNEDGTWTRMTATLDKVSNKMYSTAGEVIKYGTAFGEFIGALKGQFLKLGRYMIASFGFEEVIQVVRQGITYVKEIDDALTDLKKVTNETDAGYERFLQTMSKTAGVVGSTVAELTTMAAEWARLGYSMQEAADLAESTAILLNVSEFNDATEASEALISTIQAFGYAAEDSMHVVDILNEVGNNFAVSSDGIATALQDSASALMAGGSSMEEATALIAAANKVVRFVPRCHSNMVA